MPEEHSFVLTVAEYRTDRRSSPATGESPEVTSKSVLTLYGRVDTSQDGSGKVVTFYADSLSYDSQRPFVFQTFMSADTMYYSARGGRQAIDQTRDAELDTMLSCVFGGPALSAYMSQVGAPDSTIHTNEGCRCGEYERINAPVTLGAFLFGWHAAALSGDSGRRWRELRPVPTFSGIGFHPEIYLLYRLANTADGSSTVSVAADSTMENLETRMKNGEEVLILRDRIRVGGTLTVVHETGLTNAGEIRIREALKLVRPNAGGIVVEKQGEYTIRFSLR